VATGLPTAWFVEIEFTAGVWTDISTNVGQPVVIRVGRSDASSDVQPGTCTVVVDNVDGTFTPDNPLTGATSGVTYYPNLVEGKRLRVRVTKGTTSTRFLGRITSIVPDFPTEPTQAKTTITAVDVLGDLANITLEPGHVAMAKIMATSFWPLTETNVNAGCSDALGVSGKLVANYATSTAAFDFASDSSFSSDTDPCVTLTSGAMLWHTSPAFSTDTTGTNLNTFGGLFLLPPGVSGEVFAIGTGKRTGGASGPLVLWNGTDTVTWSGSVIGASLSSITPGWHYISLAWYGTSISRLTVDGRSVLGSGYGAGNTAHRYLSVGGTAAFTLSARDMFYAQSSGSGAMDGELVLAALAIGATLDTVVTDLIFASGILALGSTFSWGVVMPNAATILGSGGRSALDVLLDIARSQSGLTYDAYDAAAVMIVANSLSEPAALSMTVDAEADAVDGPQLSRSNIQRASRVTAKSPATSVTVVDATLATTIGSTSAEIATVLADPNDLYAAASHVLSNARDQKLRLRQFTVDLVTAQNDLYASLFAPLRLGKRIRYTNLPSAYFGVTYIDGYVQGWTEEIGVDAYRVTFDLSPADAPREAVLDTARFSWGDGICTVTSGTAVGTTAVGTIVATWTGTSTLSTTAGDYPQDFNWNGERVTVTAAPAGATSPQTLTITARGVAPTVARVHSGGESLDVWDTDNFAF
jgi:hypothetical protein